MGEAGYNIGVMRASTWEILLVPVDHCTNCDFVLKKEMWTIINIHLYIKKLDGDDKVLEGQFWKMGNG